MNKQKEYNYRQIDDLIHSRIRLAIMTILAQRKTAAFGYLKQQIGTTDGNLSSHLSKLEGADYINEKKEFVDKKPRTTYSITSQGHQAFKEYIDQLEKFIDL